MANAFEIFLSSLPTPRNFTGRLLFSVRRINNGQLTCDKLAQQFFRISPIGLNPIARLRRDQGRCDDIALASQCLKLTFEHKPAYPSFIANMDRTR